MSRRVLGAAILAAALLAPPLHAEWLVDGQAVPETAWSKQSGKLGAQLFLTDNPDQFFADWEKPGQGVKLSETDTAVRGVPIMAVVVFTGCKADSHGHCDLTVRYSTVGPDGNAWGHPMDGELWIGKAPPKKNVLQLSVDNMGIVIEPSDALGTYTVHAEVDDKIAKKTLSLERTFTAVEAKKE